MVHLAVESVEKSVTISRPESPGLPPSPFGPWGPASPFGPSGPGASGNVAKSAGVSVPGLIFAAVTADFLICAVPTEFFGTTSRATAGCDAQHRDDQRGRRERACDRPAGHDATTAHIT